MKRDDCTGLALGGNKARKLELLCAEALARGCDVLVTGGGPQSNHVRMTAAAANRLGLDCQVALAPTKDGAPPEQESGNLLLDHLLGARLHVARSAATTTTSRRASKRSPRSSPPTAARPFAIPVGGASVTGVTAYVAAARRAASRSSAASTSTGSSSPTARAAPTPGCSPVSVTTCAILGVDVGTRPDLDDVVPRSRRPPPSA